MFWFLVLDKSQHRTLSSHEAHPEPAQDQGLLEWWLRWAEEPRLGNPASAQGSLDEFGGMLWPAQNSPVNPPQNLSVDTEAVFCPFLDLLDPF